MNVAECPQISLKNLHSKRNTPRIAIDSRVSCSAFVYRFHFGTRLKTKSSNINIDWTFMSRRRKWSDFRAMGDSRGDSQVGGDCPRRTLPTRYLRRYCAFKRRRPFIRNCSNMAIASGACTAMVYSGRGVRSFEKKDCRRDIESTCGIVDVDWRCCIWGVISVTNFEKEVLLGGRICRVVYAWYWQAR